MSFGEAGAPLLIVGLAPGLHGANASGRPFTGDFAGILLYETLYAFGFADRPRSVAADDGLRLLGCRITNAVRCVPPQNRPTPGEVRTCNGYLAGELRRVPSGGVILALGAIAHRAVLHALGLRPVQHPFAHGSAHRIADGRCLIDSYHCSRYNTQTGRLTARMFSDVMATVRGTLDAQQRGS
jgi:uracil-DNA glycosylase family 4